MRQISVSGPARSIPLADIFILPVEQVATITLKTSNYRGSSGYSFARVPIESDTRSIPVADRLILPVEQVATITLKTSNYRGSSGYSFARLPIESDTFILNLVGDGGLEPPTSTMSTWRSTPELIALFLKGYFPQPALVPVPTELIALFLKGYFPQPALVPVPTELIAQHSDCIQENPEDAQPNHNQIRAASPPSAERRQRYSRPCAGATDFGLYPAILSLIPKPISRIR